MFKRQRRRSIRLQGYDYSQAGAYFITICTHNRECVLGEMVDGKINLLSIGNIAHQFLVEIPKHFKNVELDEFAVMPNHVHGIIIINSDVGVQKFEFLQKENQFQHIISASIGSIIRTFKSAVTHWCKENGYENFRWQRNYYEHIIRNEDNLYLIREYIQNNPLKWEFDEENPGNIK